MNHQKVRLALLTALAVSVSACSLAPRPLTVSEIDAQSAEDRSAMFDEIDPITGPLTLSNAMARAFKFNLDHKVKAMEEALSLNQSDLDRFDLLPALTANGEYSERSEFNATTSKDVDGAPPSSAYNYSADRSSKTGDLTVSWNILDFGVSYYTARQNTDRALIAKERRRKILHDLAKEVQSTFWRVVAAQELESRVRTGIQNAEAALRDAEKVEREKLRAPADILRYQKRLIENVRQLEKIHQQLSTAKFELASLINIPPGTDFSVVPPANDDLSVPEWNTPVSDMEALAFQNNPDLREKIYTDRITANQTRKSLVALLPGIDLSGGRNFDSNSFLDENRWFEMSATVSWNLVNALKYPTQKKYLEASEKLADARRLALRMAVMAQVYVADRQFHDSVRQFQQADKLYRIEKRLSSLLSTRQAKNAESQLDLIAQETSAISSELRRYRTYAEMVSALGRIHSTIGLSILGDKEAASDDTEALSTAIAAAIADWRDGAAVDHAIAEMKARRQKDQAASQPAMEETNVEQSASVTPESSKEGEASAPEISVAGKADATEEPDQDKKFDLVHYIADAFLQFGKTDQEQASEGNGNSAEVAVE